jgi:hypothetical protein
LNRQVAKIAKFRGEFFFLLGDLGDLAIQSSPAPDNRVWAKPLKRAR